MHRPPRFSIATAALVVGCSSAFAQNTAPFFDTTDNRHEFTNLNVETVRGVLWSAVDTWIYGLNTNASQVIVHSNLDGVIDFRWQTVANPVALAEWRTDRILVVGGGSHALAVHDRNGGAVLELIPLPSEPADIVVDPDHNTAFVSCQGANQVVRINLNTMQIVQTIDIASERPRFLFFDRGTDQTDDNTVFVAPFTSGNNSVVDGAPIGGPRPNHPFDQETARVVDLDASSQPLADQDLYAITSTMNPSTVTPVLRRAGALLAAHGRHPNGSYWMCNVESRNKDSVLNTEPLLNGQFAFNRISIGAPDGGVSPLPQPSAIDIDDLTPTSTPSYSAATSLAFPFGMAFHSTGIVVVSASMSDRIGVFDPAGNRIRPYDLQLANGSIPRHLQFDPLFEYFLVVHCWGTNVLQVFVPGSSTPFATLPLGVDPAPPEIRRGRQIWYDADRSLHGRTSCNTCHPGGKTDFLAWSISDPPHDHKDAMITQSLLSIEDTFPYHWRGERDLLAFNGAFTGLLGGTQPLSTTGPDPDFPPFQAFIFSLQAHANPFEDERRVVRDNAGIPPGSSALTNAITGQTLYVTAPSFTGRSCNECHTLPTTTNSDFNLTEVTFLPSQTTIEVAHLREMRHRDREVVQVLLPGATAPQFAPSTGAGLTHEGTIPNLTFAMGNFALTPLEREHVAAYVRQLDYGIAPLAHQARVLTSGPALAATVAAIQADWHPQAQNGWCDIVAFGDFQTGGGATTTVRWRFDPVAATYVSNDPTLFPTPLTLAALSAFASTPTSPMRSITVLGLPPNNGQRFAFDPDFDGLVDALEPTGIVADARWNPDSDGDTWPDGYEVLNGSSPTNPGSVPTDTTPPVLQGVGAGGSFVPELITTSLAKFYATTSEEAIVEVTFDTPGLPSRTYRSTRGYERVHTIVLQGLEGSTPSLVRNYTARFRAIDRQGNATPLPLPTATFASMQVVNAPAVAQPTFLVRQLSGTPASGSPPGVLNVPGIRIVIENRDFGGAALPPNLDGYTIAAQVLVRSAGSSTWSVSNTFTSPNTIVPSFDVFGVLVAALSGSTTPLPFLMLPGSYILSQPTNTSGATTLSFSQPGLQTGDEVRLRIRTITRPDTFFPAAVNDLTLGAYQMPATQPEMRELRFTYP